MEKNAAPKEFKASPLVLGWPESPWILLQPIPKKQRESLRF
jgi:hypothetical protein